MTMRRAMLIVPALLVMSGCGFFSRSKSNFYTLERIAPAGGAVTVGGAPIGVDVVELPPGFDRRDILVRKADHQLDVRGTNQWSGSLEEMVLHTLAFDLADRLPEGMVILPGQIVPNGPKRSIDLAVEDLAAGPDPVLNFDVRWTLRENNRADIASHEQIQVSLKSLDSAEIAAGTSQAIAQLADRIVARLR